MAEVKFYRCNHCGNIVVVVKDAGVTPMCCGEKMELLVAGDILDLVGHVDCGAVGAGGEGGDDRDHEDEGHEAPGDLLEDVGGLADAEGLVAGHEVAGESLALAVLEQHHDDEQNRGEHDEHGQNHEQSIHIQLSFLFISSIRAAK